MDLELVSEEDSVDMVAREVKVDMEDKVDSEVCIVVHLLLISNVYIYSRTSVAGTLMTRLPRLFRTWS